jgi:plasmid stability protein
MAQLLVRNLDEVLVRKLKRRALAHGVSAEEEHRRILKESLSRAEVKRPSLVEFLMNEGEAWPDDFLPERSKDTGAHRRVELE